MKYVWNKTNLMTLIIITFCDDNIYTVLSNNNLLQLIQTQYEFIYDAILESVFCGDTSIMATDLRSKYATLLSKDKKTGKCELEEQFKVLC